MRNRQLIPKKHTRPKGTKSMSFVPPQIPHYESNDIIKIAIIQPGSWGDNINSTLMLKPLIAKYNNPIIDVYTSILYKSAFDNNPLINNLFAYEAYIKNDALNLVHVIPNDIKNSGYNMIFNPHPMINHGNWTSIKNPQLETNLICAWIRALEHADIAYDLPLETILRLTDDETRKVADYWAKVESISKYRNLVENGPESGQSFTSPQFMYEVMDHLCSKGQLVFASRRETSNDFISLKAKHNDLFQFVGDLSIRECAELFNRCDRFIGQSSGLTNACNTNWCKKDIEWIELINSPVVSSSPIRSEGKIYWYENDITKLLGIL